MHQSAPHHCRALLPRGHRMAAAGRHQALNAARWHALSVAPRCPVQSLALTHSLSSSRSRVRRGTAMAELATSASPCLWAPSCPSVCATGSAALLLASRAPPRPSFAAVARGHRCRGRRECLCARPGQPGPPSGLVGQPLASAPALGCSLATSPTPTPTTATRTRSSGEVSCFRPDEERSRTTRMNLIFSRGLSDESVTQVNSAKKDQFVRI